MCIRDRGDVRLGNFMDLILEDVHPTLPFLLVAIALRQRPGRLAIPGAQPRQLLKSFAAGSPA